MYICLNFFDHVFVSDEAVASENMKHVRSRAGVICLTNTSSVFDSHVIVSSGTHTKPTTKNPSKKNTLET